MILKILLQKKWLQVFSNSVALLNIKDMHLFVSHLDEGVQSLSIHLQKLHFYVQHVNFCPGNHCSDKDAICGAQALQTHRSCLYTGSYCLNIFQFHLRALNIYLHRFVQAFCKERRLVPNAFHCKATTRIHCFCASEHI